MSATTVAGHATGPARPGVALSHRQVLSVVIGLMLGMFLSSLDQTIMASAIRTIGDQLHGLSLQAWVTTAYLVTSTISTPLYGKLSDIYGRKRFYLVAITIFVLGSAACSLAGSMYMLAATRAFQGLGAGGLFSLGMAMLADIVPPRERPRYQGYFLAVFGASSVLGPVVGGFFAGTNSILAIAGWRWVFLVNVPIGVVALLVIVKFYRLRQPCQPHRIDWWGAFAICVLVAPLLVVAEQGQEWGWASFRSLNCYALGAVGLLAFLLAEAWMKHEALIPLRFFRNRTFSVATIGQFIIGVCTIGEISILPLYLQIVRGATPTGSGLRMVSMTAGVVVGALLTGQVISRTGRYKTIPIVGSGLAVIGLGLLGTVEVDTPYWRVGLCMSMVGFGLGLVTQPITLAAQNAMNPRDIGVATSSAIFFRQMGSTVGAAIFVSLLFTTVGGKITDSYLAAAKTPTFRHALSDPAIAKAPANRPILAIIHGGANATGSRLNDTSFLTRITPILARPFREGFAHSIDVVFVALATVMAIALLVLLFLPHIPLRTISAMAAREAGGPSVAPAGRSPTSDGSIIKSRSLPHILADLHSADVALSNQAVIVGQVTGPDGSPAADATLTLTDFAGTQIARSLSGEDGGYRLHVPSGGTFLFVCASLGLQPVASMIIVSARESRHDVSLAGDGRLTGTVSDSVGEPIPGALLTLTDARGEVVGTAVAGADGRYAMEGLNWAEFTLTATAGGARPSAQAVVIGRTWSATVDVVLAMNGVLVGTVQAAASGAPVRDASITAIDSAGAVAGATVTDGDGHYELPNLCPGIYTVTASGYLPVATRVELLGRTTRHDILLGGLSAHGEGTTHRQAMKVAGGVNAPVDGRIVGDGATLGRRVGSPVEMELRGRDSRRSTSGNADPDEGAWR